MSSITIASRSEIGARKTNEDYLQHGAIGAGWFAVLSDGAGGHSDGAVASDLVVRMVVHEMSLQFAESQDPAAALQQVVHVANDALNQQQRGLRGRLRMHATLVVLWIDAAQRRAVWAHVGDSRLYLLRQGHILSVTRDDSVVQTMVDAGLIAPGEARRHAQRNQLLAAMGSEEPIEPHLSDADFSLADGDALLLCTDGWYDPLEPEEIEATLAGSANAREWLDRMHALVKVRAQPNQDNYSAIAVWVGDPGEITRIRPVP